MVANMYFILMALMLTLAAGIAKPQLMRRATKTATGDVVTSDDESDSWQIHASGKVENKAGRSTPMNSNSETAKELELKKQMEFEQDKSNVGAQVAAAYTKKMKVTATQNIVFGGNTHADSGSTLTRPEFAKATVCRLDKSSNHKCTECPVAPDATETPQCWQATQDGGQAVMKIDLDAKPGWERYRLEMWAKFKSAGKQFEIKPKSAMTNGKIVLYANGAEVTGSGGTFNVPAPTDKEVRIQLDFSPVDWTLASSASMSIVAKDVDDWTDACMSSKNCLQTLGGGTDLHSTFRIDNDRQWKCLENELDEPEFQETCRVWLACYDVEESREADGTAVIPKKSAKRRMIAALEAALLVVDVTSPSPEFIQTEHQHATSPAHALAQTGANADMTAVDPLQCIDPAVTDPTSWNCQCLEHVEKACFDAEPTKELSVCFKEHYCAHPNICPSWKTVHKCPTSLMEQAQQTLALMENRAKASTGTTSHLEETVTEKCLPGTT